MPSTLFEQYLQCWLLNYLLARLENGYELNKSEELISFQMSPFESPKIHKRQPNLAKIIYEIPSIRDALKRLDHNGKPGNGLLRFTCFDAINFWRQYRNALVHNRGYCTPKMYSSQRDYWSACMAQFDCKDKFSERSALPLSDELLRHCNSIIYQAAKALEDVMFVESNQKRGHPWAPNQRPAVEELPPQFAPPLLVEGDHSLSYRWRSDAEFREKYKIAPAQHGAQPERGRLLLC